jgi:signal transduction histidine kinase
MRSGTANSTAGIVPETEFLRGVEPEIEHGLFLARFANWRLSVAGAIGLAWMIGGMYHYIEPATAALRWSALVTLGFLLMAVTCFVYERLRPQPGSRAQRSWLMVWTAGSGICGAATGLLPFFLPAERVELQLSAAAIVAMLMIAFAVARAHRPLVYAMVGSQIVALCLALALHAQLLVVIPVCLLQGAFVLVFSLKLRESMRAAIGQRLYAQHLLAELQRSQARQILVQQREAALNERQRMLSELQDSLGTQLLAAQRELESGRIDSVAAATLMRECVADLRLMIGNDEPATRSLGTLLNMLRHRLQRRIEAAGLQLLWRIEDQPDSGSLEGGQALDLLRILQEAILNVLRHAGARRISVATVKSARELEITVEDDGKGFEPVDAMRSGRGIAGMQRRAARLGANLEIESREGGGTAMRLRLRLPLGGTPVEGARGAAA